MRVTAIASPLAARLCKAVDWTPLLVAAVTPPVLAVLLAMLSADPGPAGAVIMLRTAALLLGAAVAFALADDMATSTAATPAPRWLRQWLRTLLALLPAAAGWAATWAATTSSWADGRTMPLDDAALEAGTVVAVGLVCGAIGVRRAPGRQGAAGGMAALLGLSVASTFLRGRWFPWPLPTNPRWDLAHDGWLLALPITVLLLAIAHRDTRRA